MQSKAAEQIETQKKAERESHDMRIAHTFLHPAIRLRSGCRSHVKCRVCAVHQVKCVGITAVCVQILFDAPANEHTSW